MHPMSRVLSILSLFGLLLAISAAASAANETHTGKVKSATAKQIVVTHGDQDHTFQIDASTKITLRGTEAKATDLKANDSVTVTAKKSKEGNMTATKIEATRAS